MPIAAFIGPHPRHPPTERAHAIQTVDIPTDEARRLALLKGIGPKPFTQLFTPDEISKIRLSGEKARETVPRAAPEPPPFRRTAQLLFNVRVAAGGTFNPGSLSAPFPCRVKRIYISVEGDPADALTSYRAEIQFFATINTTSVITDARAGMPLLPYVASINSVDPFAANRARSEPLEIVGDVAIPFYPAQISMIPDVTLGANFIMITASVLLEELSFAELQFASIPVFESKRSWSLFPMRVAPPSVVGVQQTPQRQIPMGVFLGSYDAAGNLITPPAPWVQRALNQGPTFVR